LIVNVVGPDGGPASTPVSVAVEEHNNRREIELTKEGRVRFWGLGISAVTITVGANRPVRQTVVRNASLEWNMSVVVQVIYDSHLCVGQADHVVASRPGIRNCSALFRFFDESKNALPGVFIDRPVQNVAGASSDLFRRLMLCFRSSESGRIVASKAGYIPRSVIVKCPSDSYVEEYMVTLERAPQSVH
jgi:hypothetical protein